MSEVDIAPCLKQPIFNWYLNRLLLLNAECNDMLAQMMKREISPIAYSLDVTSREKMEEQTSELLRTAQLLNIRTVVVCSPRDYRQRIIETVLNTVSTFNRLLII